MQAKWVATVNKQNNISVTLCHSASQILRWLQRTAGELFCACLARRLSTWSCTEFCTHSVVVAGVWDASLSATPLSQLRSKVLSRRSGAVATRPGGVL